jgi:hypothetical protein
MKRIFFFLLVVFLMPVHAGDTNSALDGLTSWKEEDVPFTKKVQAALLEIQTIKPGQTRKGFLKLFGMVGGLSQREGQTYVYRKCPMIAVDVRFEKVGDVGNEDDYSGNDKIVSISNPYLAFPSGD